VFFSRPLISTHGQRVTAMPGCGRRRPRRPSSFMTEP
jgi:hypothetical protein